MPLIPDHRETIAGASAALARGELTCEELLERCLGRIDAWESQVHAWVSVDRDGARRQSRECDARLARHRSEGSVESLSPLFGIPIGIKDIIDIAGQVTAGDSRIIGVMIESNLVAGAQKLVEGKPLVYGQSITDACLGWPETVDILRELAGAVRAARG